MPLRKIPADPADAARALLEFLNDPDYRPLAQRELLHRGHVPQKDRPRVRRLIRELIERSRMRKIGGGKLVAVLEQTEVRGRLERHRGGYARIVPDDGTQDVLVASRHLAEARPGDEVEARVVSRGRDGHLRGIISEVISSDRGEMLGLLLERARGDVVRPFDPVLGTAIHVAPASRHGAGDMHAVRFEIVGAPAGRTSREARVLESLGHLDEPGTDVAVVVRKYGLAGEFPAPVLRATANLPSEIGKKQAAGRERFDKPSPVTIDGETAKDFDDAIAVERLGDGYRLYVHIADVAHFVEEGSPLDREARKRGTSVYFPDRVVPMFPERLSNDLCSLRPDEDRLVQSVVVDLDGDGAVSAVRFSDGVIRSAARLTYTQVADHLEGRTSKGIPRPVREMLSTAAGLLELLERRRHRRGSIDFDLPRPQILLDVEGAMTGITLEPTNRAHAMIEEFMLLANEVVAGHLEQHDAPCLYRVHQAPDPVKLEALAGFVRGFGLELVAKGEEIVPRELQQMIESVQGRPEARVVGQATLQAMQQARYSIENTGHFGLAAQVYCHFTSPIRRYPDLVVHRELRRLRRGDTTRGEGDSSSVAEHSSERERNAEWAERELLAWKKVAFIDGHVGESYEGLVTGVTRFGLFVQLVENLVEGLIRVEQLGDEWFEFDAESFALCGQESGRSFRLGDRMRVRVDKVDRVLRRVDFSPVDGPPPRGPAAGRRQKGPRQRTDRVRKRGRGK